ncbi:hypothetical protein PR048_013995 [Dryococelus australis]|uniref:Uncharacterized protein n=1 Tax=Dryococelus australis TaxID=614101 RepID=A0ABQ9HTQ8_9NEOP|nr:hypothetical protein PR048_013995 [Dryococelus australis]
MMSLIHNDRFNTIYHHFLVSGHIYMPCNHDFGVIEAEKRRQYVYTPEDWRDAIPNLNWSGVDVTRGTHGRPTKAATSNKVLAGITLPQKFINDVPIKPAKLRNLLSLLC